MKSSCLLFSSAPARRALGPAALSVLAILWLAAAAGGQELTVLPSVPMAVQLVKHVPLKVGQPLEARLLYPVYVDNELAIPAGTILEGDIVSLTPDKRQRLEGRLQGDFTPFRKPAVEFHQITFPSGEKYAITSDTATNGTPILHLTAAKPHSKRAFIHAQFSMAIQQAKDEAGLITKPGRGDRIEQFLYRQLPYHPQRIEPGTAWNVNLAEPLRVPAQADPPKTASTGGRGKPSLHRASSSAAGAMPPGTELLHAYLTTTISSATARPGDTFQAWVTQPVYDEGHKLTVPEGAVLIGTVTQAKPAKSFGRKGKLRFSFRELEMPGGKQQNVDGMLAGADASRSASLQIDSEGGVQPKSQNKAAVPLVLSVLASRAFDTDGNQAGNGAVASNGFGIVGRISGIVAGPRAVAAGIGFYGAGLSVFNRWIAPGKDVTFTKDTRIDVLTTPARSRLSGDAASPKS